MGCLSDFNFENFGRGGTAGKSAGNKDDNVGAQAIQKFYQILTRLIDKRDASTPKVIASGNYCKNPCYEFNLNLVSECPKCKGAVVMEYENDYTTTQAYDKNGHLYEKKIYNKTCCNQFDFDSSISAEDRDFSALVNYFQKSETEGTTTKYYMLLEGERIDLGTQQLFQFLYLNQKKLLPEKNGVETILSFINLGKCTIYLLNQGGFERLPIACLYRCNKCGHKYHIMQTSPLMYRDKSKDGKEDKKEEAPAGN